MKIFSSEGGLDTASNTPSIFLAGPTLRFEDAEIFRHWRDDAVNFFENMGFDGHIYTPEPMGKSYERQIDWEVYHLNIAKCILFWVPRDMNLLPGLTTNIEWGEWMHSGKVVFGAPNDAQRVNYMQYRAKNNNMPFHRTLEETVAAAIKMSEDRANLNPVYNFDFEETQKRLEKGEYTNEGRAD